jgi:hypothetical protein
VKTSSMIAVGFAALLSGSIAAYAQTEQPTIHHHYHVHHYVGPHHTVHHHYVAAPEPVPAAAVTPPQAAPFGLAFPHIAPYPDNKGDEDGLSEDEDDCNKGCIDGNGAD